MASQPPSPANRFYAPRIEDEVALVADAPESMSSVVGRGTDDEDGENEVGERKGSSGRTEKMHRFLAKEFHGTTSTALSYGNICSGHAEGRRELIAGCFFELLVLKTNGVVSLTQRDPYADISIQKARQWLK